MIIGRYIIQPEIFDHLERFGALKGPSAGRLIRGRVSVPAVNVDDFARQSARRLRPDRDQAGRRRRDARFEPLDDQPPRSRPISLTPAHRFRLERVAGTRSVPATMGYGNMVNIRIANCPKSTMSIVPSLLKSR